MVTKDWRAVVFFCVFACVRLLGGPGCDSVTSASSGQGPPPRMCVVSQEPCDLVSPAPVFHIDEAQVNLHKAPPEEIIHFLYLSGIIC